MGTSKAISVWSMGHNAFLFSGTDGVSLYRTSEHECTCVGYAFRQSCKHVRVARLLSGVPHRYHPWGVATKQIEWLLSHPYPDSPGERLEWLDSRSGYVLADEEVQRAKRLAPRMAVQFEGLYREWIRSLHPLPPLTKGKQ